MDTHGLTGYGTGVTGMRRSLGSGGAARADVAQSLIRYGTGQGVSGAALLVVFDGSSTVNTIGVASNLTASALVGRRVVVAGRSASDWLVIAAV